MAFPQEATISADRAALQAGRLASPVPALAAHASCEEARATFDRDACLSALAIVDAERRPVGLLNRFRFLERIGFLGADRILGKPVTFLMESSPLILDETNSIDEVGQRVMSQQDRSVLDGFIVTSGGRYSGLGTGLDVIRAFTERRQVELEQLALHDLLTGLPNRALFEQEIGEAMRIARRGTRMAVLYIDLDRFKDINDTLGHRFGDLVLCGISQRLRGALRKSDVVARLSGDEFAILLTDLVGGDDAADIARVLVQSCAAPLTIDGRDAAVSCSIGVAVYPEHGRTQEALLRSADAALCRAKETRNCWEVYAPDMQPPGTSGLTVHTLRQALEQGGLTVHYQPIVDLATDRIHSVEALVRWTDNSVAPIDIVHLAESSGLIVPLTEFVMRSAFLQMRRWDEATGRRDLRLSINVSAVQLSGPGMLEMIDRLIAESAFDTTRLDLELTERAAMRASPAVQAALDAMRERGITLTLDDFGTGYSALSRLDRLPIDAMKIDKSFLERVEDAGDGVVARAIIGIGHALGKRIVGEGVETPEQLEFLRREGCKYAQGYFIGRPAAAASLTAALVA